MPDAKRSLPATVPDRYAPCMRLFLLLMSCALSLPAAGASAQQINRCTNAQGVTVYSDRRCEDVDASPRMPARQARDAGSSGLYRDSCARRLSDLVAQIQSAVEAKDVNRLSSIYLWNGMSNAASARVLDQLEAIVQSPLLDIAPVFAPAPAYQATPAAAPAYTDASRIDGAAPRLPSTTTVVESSAPPRQRPVALRLEQRLGTGSTSSRTVLELQRQYNCFWISL